MNDDAKSERELFAEATHWLLTLREAPEGSPLFAEFEVWLRSSADHRMAWESVNHAWGFLGTAQPAYRGKNWTAPSEIKVPSRRRGMFRGRYRGPVAAALSVAALCLLWLAAPAVLLTIEADYQTATGETRLVRMEDGSTLELGGDSAVATDVDAGQRHVSLLAGEVFFDVARDENRPFVVEAGDVRVTVLGTAFDVGRSSRRTTVALLRGAVSATVEGTDGSSFELHPGQQLVFDHASGEAEVADISLEDIGAWRDSRMALSDVTVAEAVEMVQRYHPAWISLPDRGLADRKVSGLFDLGDPDRALTAIVGAFGGKVRSVTPMLRVISRL
ncbi:FecR family protein [Pseudomonas sp. R2.Fl]|nr:FecR family protein [Pseudomonas sp. R2.Fl]